MKPQGAQKENFYNKFSVGLTMDGSLKEILQFIHSLQGPSHHLTVSELHFEKAVQTPNVLVAKLVLSRILIPQEKQ